MANQQQDQRPQRGQRDTDPRSKTSRVVRPDDDKRTGQPPPEDVDGPDGPAAMPQATAKDQIGTMEAEGQARKPGHGP